MPRVTTGLLLLAALASSIGACASARPETPKPEDPPVLVVNLTSGRDNLHAAWMGLSLAQHGLADGREVIVFMNVSAPPLASAKQTAGVAFQGNRFSETIAEIIGRGGKVIVCPACAELMGVKQEDLLPGVGMADRDSLFGRLNTRSVVFSY